MSKPIVESSLAAQPSMEQGTTAATRRIALGDPAKIPAAPPHYAKLDGAAVRELRKVPESLGAEVTLAIEQIIQTGPTLQVKFGEVAPDVSQAAALWKRYTTAVTGGKAAEKLVEFYGDVEMVAGNDVLELIAEVDRMVRPAAERNTALREQFSAVLAVSEQRGAVIRQAKARATQNKKGSPDPSVK